MQRKTWYSILRLDAMPLSLKNLLLMGKTCNFDSNLSAFNSVDLKKAQKLSKANFFFQGPNLKSKGQHFQIL
jgi:hypothetical protein